MHVVADRCHRKGYLHLGFTLCWLLFTVHDGDDDDNDSHFLHGIRRDRA